MDKASSEATLQAAQKFILHETRLLDERRLEEWMELFAADGYYWAPARPEQSDPWSEVSLFFDDREIMKNRITRLRHPKIYAQIPPSRGVRQVSNFGIERIDPETRDVEIRSVFFMFEYRPTTPKPTERVFAGEYRHLLRPTDSSFVIRWKKATVANCDAAFAPLFVYF